MAVIFNPIKVNDIRISYHKTYDSFGNETTHKTEEEVEITYTLKDFIKEEVPTARFWLMLKLKHENWQYRWSMYIEDLKKRIIAQMEGESKSKEHEAKRIIGRIENSAWRTMPSSFLSMLHIPRVIRK